MRLVHQYSPEIEKKIRKYLDQRIIHGRLIFYYFIIIRINKYKKNYKIILKAVQTSIFYP